MTYKEQKRQIIKSITPFTNNEVEAEEWFTHRYIPALNCTAHQALKNGFYKELRDYLSTIELGGYA